MFTGHVVAAMLGAGCSDTPTDGPRVRALLFPVGLGAVGQLAGRDREGRMAGIMLDSDDLVVLLAGHAAGIRVATYADIVTPSFIQATTGRLVVIDRGLGDPHQLATVADVEPGALSVTQGAEKIRQWHTEKRPFPTAYHDRNDWQAVINALGGVPAYHWVATLDGTANPDGQYPAVVQVLDESHLGFHADLSVVWDDGWRPLPAGPTVAKVDAVRAALATFLASGPELQKAIEGL